MKLDLGAWLLNIKSSDVYQCFLSITQTVNTIDDGNISPLQLSGASIQDAALTFKKMNWTEIPIPLFKVMPAASTTSSVDGGYFLYDPNRFPNGSWYLEATIEASSGATATLNLKNGSTVIASVSTTQTSWQDVRTPTAITLPSVKAVLTCTLQATAGTANALGASLIYISN